MKFSLYLDESGDHNLEKINEQYPILAIAGCIFENDYYTAIGNELINQFKLKYWNTIAVILVSSQIRKQEGCFAFMKDENKRREFYADLNNLISNLRFTIISAIVFKIPHKNKHKSLAENPYSLCIDFIMERFKFFLGEDYKGAIIAESRGFKENKELKEEFDRCKLRGTYFQSGFDRIEYLRTEDKKENINGMQIADLTAYPIGSYYLYPFRNHPSFDILRPKFRKSWYGKIEGYGVVILPKDYEKYQLIDY